MVRCSIRDQSSLVVAHAVALIYNFQDWGTYSCCFKKCCQSKDEEDPDSDSDENDSTQTTTQTTTGNNNNKKKKLTKQTKKMRKWFREYYHDEQYQKITDKYFNKVVMLSPDSSRYTGGQKIGNQKKATREQLKARIAEAKDKVELLEKDLKLHDAAKKKSEEAEAKANSRGGDDSKQG